MEKDGRSIRESIQDELTALSKDMYSVTPHDKFTVVALSVRKELARKWLETQQHYYHIDAKRLYFLSLEFLLGRLLRNYLINLDLFGPYAEAMDAISATMEDVLDRETDAALGNGGLGRLAACFLDSMATLRYPCYGYGIRYEYGMFFQKIRDGYQTEGPDNWLRYGNPWEFPRPELLYPVRFFGRVETYGDRDGRSRSAWVETDDIMAMAYDYPVPGFRNEIVNTLRLWAAKSTREFNLDFFNSGDYVRAVEDKNNSENISKVLYPNDYSSAGKELRLKQQYFFVAATLADVVRRYKKFHTGYGSFPDKVGIQLNDTHPTIAIPELMRIMIDEEGFEWDEAWSLTEATFGYTNHTILPEALETWPEEMLARMLPRHLQIVREINRRFLIHVSRRFPDQPEKKESTALITGDGSGRVVHMARMAIVGSHATNGVSRLHSDILKKRVFSDFYLMYPDRFLNVTNGITQRRWLLAANPGLAALISEALGDGWTRELEELRGLEKLADDGAFRARFDGIKQENKRRLASLLGKEGRNAFDPAFLLDCQVKRFHEYKRQVLNLLHAITLYNRIREGKADDASSPRVILFSGKSAPGYVICKLMIKLIHNVADVIEAHPLVRTRLRVVFAENYGVSLAEAIIPAAELSEQISTAGYEASGTGNMKFMLNGALTIGTLDGANVEIREQVGEENFFHFGMSAQEVEAAAGQYDPRACIERSGELAQIIGQLSGGFFSPEEPHLFDPIVETLLANDRYFVLADYPAYIACQERVSEAYRDRAEWTRKAILNVARSGLFSSDRAISEYAGQIWHMSPAGGDGAKRRPAGDDRPGP